MDKAVENSVSKIIPDRFKERLIEALESNRGKAAGTSHKLLVVCLPARVFVHIFVVLLLTFTLISVTRILEAYFESNPIECNRQHVEEYLEDVSETANSDVIVVDSTEGNGSGSSSTQDSDL